MLSHAFADFYHVKTLQVTETAGGTRKLVLTGRMHPDSEMPDGREVVYTKLHDNVSVMTLAQWVSYSKASERLKLRYEASCFAHQVRAECKPGTLERVQAEAGCDRDSSNITDRRKRPSMYVHGRYLRRCQHILTEMQEENETDA